MEEANRCAHMLHLYLVELNANVKRLQELGILQRNPFFRSTKAKQLLRDVEENMQHCLDATLVFMAHLTRCQLCDEAAIKGYRGACQILFDFQDTILRQEIEHQLLLKDTSVLQRLHRYVVVSEHMLLMVKKA